MSNSKGLAVTLVCNRTDFKVLNEAQDTFEVTIIELPNKFDLSSYKIKTGTMKKGGNHGQDQEEMDNNVNDLNQQAVNQ